MANNYLSLRKIMQRRNKAFIEITWLIEKINRERLMLFEIKVETKTEYEIKYIEEYLRKKLKMKKAHIDLRKGIDAIINNI